MSETVKLTYKGAAPAIVPDAGIVAEPGKSYPVPADIAASLLKRPDWEPQKAKKESE